MSARFSEEEARQIFARAAERQHAVRDASEGLSVEELQAIGAEAGLDPAHVTAAIAELRAVPEAPPPLVLGVDPAPRRVRVLPGALTDAAWGQLVSRFKRTFGSVGIESAYGSIREWTSGATSNLHVVAEPVEGGTRLLLETRREGAAVPIVMFPAMGLFLIVIMLGLGAGTGKLGDPAIWLMVLMGLVLGGVGAFGSWRALASWSETRAEQFEALLDEAEGLVDVAPAASVTDGTAAGAPIGAGRIDAGLLDADGPEPPEAAERDRAAQRRRV